MPIAEASEEVMSPDAINQKHGKPSWKCWHCRAESDLLWWNGLSVAVCAKKVECGRAYSEFLARDVEAEQSFRDHVEAEYGPQNWP